jgi:hypothetical protein
MALDILHNIRTRFACVGQWDEMDQTTLATTYLPRHDIESVICVFVHAILVHEYEFCDDEKKKLRIKQSIAETFGVANVSALVNARAALEWVKGGPCIPCIFQNIVRMLFTAIEKQRIVPPETDPKFMRLQQKYQQRGMQVGQAEDLTYERVLGIFEECIEFVLDLEAGDD